MNNIQSLPKNQNTTSKETASWEPLFSIDRSGHREITIFGSLVVWLPDNHPFPSTGKAMIQIGDIHQPIWSRSLLKPWQLLANLPSLTEHYPLLKEAHLAMMMSSHNSDPEQVQLLQQICLLGDLTEKDLQCPACYPPMNPAQKSLLIQEGKPESTLYNPCSGKHLGHLMANSEEASTYLKKNSNAYERLEDLLGALFPDQNFGSDTTIDGCLMPNYPLSPKRLAQLYCGLFRPTTVTGYQKHWQKLAPLMTEHPEIIGGIGRLDTRIMQGALFSSDFQSLKTVAKEGADGLLGVGIEPSDQYPNGLGILVKLASGYDPKHLETVIQAVFYQLGLSDRETALTPEHLKTVIHFECKQP